MQFRFHICIIFLSLQPSKTCYTVILFKNDGETENSTILGASFFLN